VTPRTARRQLRALVDEGLALPLPPARQQHPGRPRLEYRLVLEKLDRRPARGGGARPGSGAPAGDDVPAEPRHLLPLRRELQQHQAGPRLLVGAEPVGDLVRRADQAAAQAAV
jgi:hypothetical protein